MKEAKDAVKPVNPTYVTPWFHFFQFFFPKIDNWQEQLGCITSLMKCIMHHAWHVLIGLR